MTISVLKRTAIAAALTGLAAFSGVASADPINYIPAGTEISIKFVNYEVQITQLGQELFGLINITQINNANGTATFWNGNGSTDGTQLVGYFEGLTAVADQTGGTGLSFTGGIVKLFNVANGTFSPTTTPNTKNYVNQLCGGVAACLANPWLEAAFAPGILDSINQNATLQAAFATPQVQAGNGFLSVTGGANKATFDTNGFVFTNFAAADISLRSNFTLANNSAGSNCTLTDSAGWGVCSDDPLRAKTVPEPGTIALFGLGALALGALRRKKVA